MDEEYWLVNSNRSKLKRFHKNRQNKDKFFEYIFIDSGKISGVFGKQPPVMTIREELKIKKAREKWNKHRDSRYAYVFNKNKRI